MDQATPAPDARPEAEPKHARILAAAATALVAEGPQCSMASIARRAGVATGSLYTYFAGKDELVLAVHHQLARDMQAALVPDVPAASARARFDAYLDGYIDFFWSDPDRAILFEMLSNLPIIPPAELVASYAPSSRYIQSVLADLTAGPAAPLPDPATTAAFLGGAIRNALKWHRARGDTLTPAAAGTLRALCWWLVPG